MYVEETILPVRTKNMDISSSVINQSQARIYFVQNQTQKSLRPFKWFELVFSVLCVGFAISRISGTGLKLGTKLLITLADSFGTLIVLLELVYSYFKKNLSLTFQIGSSAMDFAIFITTTTMLYYTNYLENLNQIFLYLNGFTSIIFLTDFLCKITMSSLLYQAIQEKFVIDVGVNTINFPSSSSSKPKFQGTKSSLTTTPITYGGTFPIGKNQPPFLPEERLNYPPAEGCSYYCPSETKCFKHNSKSMNLIQFYPRHEDKGTSTLIPFYLEEERVKRKSPWTLSTLTNSRKIESRKQTTPITYSGTFAVNKDLVPITGSSPKASPRVRKLHPIRSAGNSPRRDDSVTFGNSRRLDHISEERVSMECSSLKSLEEYYSQSSILPGSVVIE